MSYFFYAYWNWKLLSLLIFSSVVDFVISNLLNKTINKDKRKWLLVLSAVVNIGILIVFKYFNFFLDNFNSLLTFFGYNFQVKYLDILLPFGISFYTFQTLSYTIDVYKEKLKPTKDFITFLLYVSFFPQLVAGPIERAKNLLPQIENKRVFNYTGSIEGLRLILWGLFLKIVIADHCGFYVDEIFNNYSQYSSSTLVVGAFLFSFQIYGDFAGYTYIAIGVARLFGVNLSINFLYPYFSTNIPEFWKRWHISLTTWFKDYVYIPLGGNKESKWKTIQNTFIVFVISALWHGANWTFIVWGMLHFLFFLPKLLSSNTSIQANNKEKSFLKKAFQMLFTFCLVTFAWIFFRANSVTGAFGFIESIFTWKVFSIPEIFPKTLIGFIMITLLIEWQYRYSELIFKEFKLPKYLRYSFYYVLVILVLYYYTSNQQFIYFQF